MTPLQELQALADPTRAAEMAAYHKADRHYLGVPVPERIVHRGQVDAAASTASSVAARPSIRSTSPSAPSLRAAGPAPACGSACAR